MGTKKRQQITIDIFDKLIAPLRSEMVIWKVGLYYGSKLYFEMGNRCIDSKINRDVGTISLTLEADDWQLIRADRELCNASTVSRELVENSLNDQIVGATLGNVNIDYEHHITTISFTNGDLLTLPHECSGANNGYHLIFTLYLPGKSIVLTQGPLPELVMEIDNDCRPEMTH
jgi:hypothetical protein